MNQVLLIWLIEYLRVKKGGSCLPDKLINSKINEKVKWLAEQRNIRLDGYKKTWIKLVDSEKFDVNDIGEIYLELHKDVSESDELYLFDKLTGDCLGLYKIIGLVEDGECLRVELESLVGEKPDLSVNEILLSEEISSSLKDDITNSIGENSDDRSNDE